MGSSRNFAMLIMFYPFHQPGAKLKSHHIHIQPGEEGRGRLLKIFFFFWRSAEEIDGGRRKCVFFFLALIEIYMYCMAGRFVHLSFTGHAHAHRSNLPYSILCTAVLFFF